MNEENKFVSYSPFYFDLSKERNRKLLTEDTLTFTQKIAILFDIAKSLFRRKTK